MVEGRKFLCGGDGGRVLDQGSKAGQIGNVVEVHELMRRQRPLQGVQDHGKNGTGQQPPHRRTNLGRPDHVELALARPERLGQCHVGGGVLY